MEPEGAPVFGAEVGSVERERVGDVGLASGTPGPMCEVEPPAVVPEAGCEAGPAEAVESCCEVGPEDAPVSRREVGSMWPEFVGDVELPPVELRSVCEVEPPAAVPRAGCEVPVGTFGWRCGGEPAEFSGIGRDVNPPGGVVGAPDSVGVKLENPPGMDILGSSSKRKGVGGKWEEVMAARASVADGAKESVGSTVDAVARAAAVSAGLTSGSDVFVGCVPVSIEEVGM